LSLDSGAKIHFRDEGRADGPPVVLIHGANASLHTWEPWVNSLGDGYRIITLDLPAHGLTGKVPDRDYSSANQVATVDAVAQHLGVDRFVLGGNSMGGGVTWRYTLEHPDKIEAMILVDAVGLPQWSVRESESTEQDSNRGPLVFRLMRQPWFRAIARYIDPYRLTKQGLESAYSDKSKVTEELIDRYYELALREGSREAIVDRFASFGGESIADTIDPAQFTVPTLIMWGRDDALISVNVAEKFAESLPDNSLVIYDDVGHLPMEEIPEQSATDVLAFLGKLQSEPAATQEAVTE
jgi:pimeloyl-ACP methyl ester carboxylesterase